MAYILNGTTIRNPMQIVESQSSQYAQNRTLDGTIARDYFGSAKRRWVFSYRNAKKADYDAIKAVYDSYMTNASPKTWQSTETNYLISLTNVHIDLIERNFNVRGSDYLSDFDLILTEA